MRRTALLSLLLLTACPPAADLDGDGFDGDEDCDDANADVNPAAVELCNAVDDDCDGVIDDDPADEVTSWADADADGFGDPDSASADCVPAADRVLDSTDCDDARDDVHPGADELCDDVDHDCDGALQEGAVDPVPWYADLDGDTFGDPASTTDACDAPADHVEDDSDCDDTNADVHPEADEVACNALDDDCDGTTDVNSVPTDHATIAEAVTALPDASTICLQPGTYTERVDLGGRELTFVGGGGPEVTIFDIGTDLPLLSADAWDEDHDVVDGDVADLTFVGVTVTGSEWTTTDDVDGGFLYLGGGSVRFEGVVVTGIHPTLIDTHDVAGLLVDADAASVDVVGLEVTDVGFTFGAGAGDGTKDIDGGLVNVEGGHADIQDATVTGLSVATQDAPSSCSTDGAFVRVREGSLLGSAWVLDGGTVDQDCSGQSHVDGFYVNVSEADSTLGDVSITTTLVEVASSGSASIDGVGVKLSSGDHTWSGMQIHDNRGVSTSDQSSSHARGVVRGSNASLALSHSSFTGNELRGVATGGSTSGVAEGAITNRGPLDLSHVDLRGNTAHGDDRGEGGAVRWSEDNDAPGSTTFTNFIVAGNTARGGEDARGGGIYLDAEEEHAALFYGDIVGNTVVAGTDTGRGGGLYDRSEDEGGSLTVSGVCIANNTLQAGAGGDLDGEAVYIADDVPLSWTYNNVTGPASVDLFDGMDDPTGTDGNLSADPLYTSTAGDPTTWDLTLQGASPNTGAANPAQQDADGTPASIGAYGGPDAAWPE